MAAPDVPAAQARAEQTFLFVDLAGYTALTEAHGDEQAADLVTRFCAEVGALLPDYGAEQVKSIGDAVMVRVADAGRALRLGLRLMGELGARHGYPALRVGMHSGPAVERGGDWFGASVNLAARVSGAAAGGEVLLTAATLRQAGEPDGVELEHRGRMRLRNVAEPIDVYAATASERDRSGAPVDPVCRMVVDPRHEAGTLRHGGRTFHFCSLACAAAFAAGPAPYLEQG